MLQIDLLLIEFINYMENRMAKFIKFEDMLIWQKSRVVVNLIYDFTSKDNFKRDFELKNQIIRAGISIMLNVAEGFWKADQQKFKTFLFYANGSVTEVQSALYIALDHNYISPETFNDIFNHCTEISKMISGLISYLKLN